MSHLERLTSGRRQSRMTWLYALFAVLLVMGLAVVGAMTSSLHNLAEGDQATLARQGLVDSVEQVRKGAGAIDSRPLASGEAGVIEGYAKQSMSRVLQVRQEYMTELKAAGLQTLLTPASLKTDPTLAKSEAKLRKLRGIVAKYHDRNIALQNEITAGAERLNLSPAARQGLTAGLEKARTSNMAKIEHLWTMESGILEAYADTAQFLKASRGQWTVADNNVMFRNAASLAGFRAHIQRIVKLSETENRERDQALATIEQGLTDPSTRP